MQEFVKPPFFMNEGAMHLGRGRFILPVAGPGVSKEASHRTKGIIAIATVVVVVVVFVIAFLLSYQEPYGLPMQKDILESVGKPISEVAAHLEVSVDSMQQIEPGLYRIPAACKHKGIILDILLEFEEHEGLLRNYGYEAQYSASKAKATRDVNAIKSALAIDDKTSKTESVGGTARRELEMHSTDSGAFVAEATLNGTILSTTALAEYMDYLESAEYYEGRSGEYLVKKAMYYEQLHIAYEPELEELSIKLWCTIETDRSKDY